MAKFLDKKKISTEQFFTNFNIFINKSIDNNSLSKKLANIFGFQ